MAQVADLSEAQIVEAREVFNYYARNNNELSGKDLYTALRCCGVNPTLKEINEATGGGKDVAFPAFLEVIGQTVVDDTKGEILKAFQIYDKEGTGSVAAGDLEAILKGSGDKLTKAELKWAMSKAGKGAVKYAAFLEQMFQGLPEVGEVGGGGDAGGFGDDDDGGFGGGGFGDDDDDGDAGDGDEFGF